jgi:hypothetical protein
VTLTMVALAPPVPAVKKLSSTSSPLHGFVVGQDSRRRNSSTASAAMRFRYWNEGGRAGPFTASHDRYDAR